MFRNRFWGIKYICKGFDKIEKAFNIMKKLILAAVLPAILLFCAFSASAQQTAFERVDQWKFMYEIQGVNFYYKVLECHDVPNNFHKEYVVLKVQNTNDTEMNVQWDIRMYYNGKCFNCESTSTEYHKSLNIAANVSVEGDCDPSGGKLLRIFSKFLNYEDPGSTLTNFELLNITIVEKK